MERILSAADVAELASEALAARYEAEARSLDAKIATHITELSQREAVFWDEPTNINGIMARTSGHFLYGAQHDREWLERIYDQNKDRLVHFAAKGSLESDVKLIPVPPREGGVFHHLGQAVKEAMRF